MSSEGGEVKLECHGCNYDVVYANAPKENEITVCPRCATVQVCRAGKEMRFVDQELFDTLSQARIDAIDALIRTVQDTKIYTSYLTATCEMLLKDFSATTLGRGLSLEQVMPAVSALFNKGTERMDPLRKIKTVMEVMKGMGAITMMGPPDEELNDERVNSGGGSA